jgi:hypothetical protein
VRHLSSGVGGHPGLIRRLISFRESRGAKRSIFPAGSPDSVRRDQHGFVLTGDDQLPAAIAVDVDQP